MIVAPIWQAVVFGLCAGLALVLEVTMQPDLALQLLLLAPLVAILGLPHGALDLPIAEALWPLDGWSGKLKFALLYLGLAAAVITVWILVPGVALAAFLAYSALHFSDDWSQAASPLRWTGGVATIGAPVLFHREEVVTLFSELASPAAAVFCANAGAAAGVVGLCVFFGTCLFKPNVRGPAATEQVLLWGSSAFLPPLLFFTVYFCGLHSIRHFNATIRSIPNARRSLVISAFLSVIVILAAAIFLLTKAHTNPEVLSKSLLQAIFIGLAALTVPHMILVGQFRDRQTEPLPISKKQM